MKKKFILSFILSLICFTLVFKLFGDKIFLGKNSIPVTDNVPQKELDLGEDNKIEKRVENEILFLMMGVDANGTGEYKNIRTDTMMLFKVNFQNGEINLLSIPRDTRVLVKGKKDKINHAHSYGGSELTMRTVRDFLNLDIDYYVKVDYNAVMKIVDAIGGVEIDVPFDMKYKDNTPGYPPLNINIKKGLRVLDGKNAHDFLRWRKNNSRTVQYPEGDVGRIKAQQMFMRELIKQTLKPKNIIKIPFLVETYINNVETNIPTKEILKGAKLASKIDIDSIKTDIIPGGGKTIRGTSYFIYDEAETEELVRSIFKDYLLNE
ncbi:LytR family transcriptional attenuator [Tissierella praeacuta]|uniref:LCP family protein n=1 Tax=Tissierella praeacuta TaxID=43131 RepID=UPI00104C6F3C|nr:LCP family protein [Tissierella praeacuta]TCU77427.1 LytR family transcriptional attenuator [Tissierella praeacuta]